MESLTAKLYKSPKTVFTDKDLALLWEETDRNNLKAKTAYYVKTGVLLRLTRGVFAKDKNYHPKELATSIYTPSYISFETVLREAGIIFQYYETIFVATRWSFTKNIAGNNITFRKLKDGLLFSPDGIENKGTYCIATPERAFLDMLYVAPNYFFDNLSMLNWELCFKIAEIYNNKQLIKRLNNYKDANVK